MENGASGPHSAENAPANAGSGAPEKRPLLTGDAGCLWGALLLLIGGGMFAFWFLFMSWSHNANYEAEEWVKMGGAIFGIAGAILLARWWAARPTTPNPKK